MSTESSLRESLDNKYKAIKVQGEFVRKLKSSHASKSEYDEAVKVLRDLKLERAELQIELKAVLSHECNGGNGFNGMSRETFREAAVKSLRKRMFYTHSEKSVAEFYEFGPPGCFIKQNILDIWRQNFALQELVVVVAAFLDVNMITYKLQFDMIHECS
ncbi:glycyl-tRNA synthetase / glycine--tRNA ligase [Artemisia annua]|uniref:Glycyl-tRNA synthetase / glycine--tRNA ligase n=1 Tax=Artemisia annua TaxID=35608 RepID=A0A2U1NNJ3_ARTAN|nr:glycyl-tRNA synthetase / glycine--tRNA ligase [Artemisia annua]